MGLRIRKIIRIGENCAGKLVIYIYIYKLIKSWRSFGFAVAVFKRSPGTDLIPWDLECVLDHSYDMLIRFLYSMQRCTPNSINIDIVSSVYKWAKILYHRWDIWLNIRNAIISSESVKWYIIFILFYCQGPYVGLMLLFFSLMTLMADKVCSVGAEWGRFDSH